MIATLRRLRGGAALVGLVSPAALCAQASAPVAAHLGGGGDLAVSFARIIVSLIFCVIIAALAILLLRQRSGKVDLRGFLTRIEPGRRAIDIVETRRLSPHADACVIRHADREYLLVLQQGSTHVLRDRALDVEPVSSEDA